MPSSEQARDGTRDLCIVVVLSDARLTWSKAIYVATVLSQTAMLWDDIEELMPYDAELTHWRIVQVGWTRDLYWPATYVLSALSRDR